MHRITQKQTNFIYEYLNNGGIAVQAALASYDTKNYKSASKIADTNLNNSYIQKSIEEALNKKEITADKIANIFDDGLNARIATYSPETKEYNESKIPDYNVRYKYLELIFNIFGVRK